MYLCKKCVLVILLARSTFFSLSLLFFISLFISCISRLHPTNVFSTCSPIWIHKHLPLLFLHFSCIIFPSTLSFSLSLHYRKVCMWDMCFCMLSSIFCEEKRNDETLPFFFSISTSFLYVLFHSLFFISSLYCIIIIFTIFFNIFNFII